MPLQPASICWSCDFPMCNDLHLWVCIALRCSINVRLLIFYSPPCQCDVIRWCFLLHGYPSESSPTYEGMNLRVMSKVQQLSLILQTLHHLTTLCLMMHVGLYGRWMCIVYGISTAFKLTIYSCSSCTADRQTSARGTHPRLLSPGSKYWIVTGLRYFPDKNCLLMSLEISLFRQEVSQTGNYSILPPGRLNSRICISLATDKSCR